MEPKQAAKPTSMMHGVITSTVSYRGHRNKTHTECVATLDNGMKIALQQSGDANSPRAYSSVFDDPFRRSSYSSSLSRSAPPPLEIGSHVMVDTDPNYHVKDTRVQYPIARIWRRAKPDEIPAASGAAFKARVPLSEPRPEPPPAVAAQPYRPRTTSFSANSVLARTIERKVGEAMRTDGTVLILYDPAAALDYPFICLGKDFDTVRAASRRLSELGSFGSCVFSSGASCSGYIDEMPSGFTLLMQSAQDMTFIPVEGLVRQSGPKAEIEESILRFCLFSPKLRM